MKPYYYYESGLGIIHGKAEDVLPSFAPARFSTVITDPPYHLTQASRGGSPRNNDPATPFGRTRLGSAGFMGKTWDGGDIAFRPELWAEVLRVCKPGAMLLAFGGTRTFHRLACAIEDAGWEIRDCLMWLYGSGFPKSLDISKAIDKAAGAEREVLTEGKPLKRMIPGADQNRTGSWIKDNGREFVPSVTAPATDAARQWSGWGTALKPAWEPIIVAMKPLAGTFAENALRHGVAGLNIDGGRIGSGGGGDRNGEATAEARYTGNGGTNFAMKPGPRGGAASGRWPANVLLDEAAAAQLDEMSGTLASGTNCVRRREGYWGAGDAKNGGLGSAGDEQTTYGDSGGASRFFYTAKASKADRGHGNDHATVKPTPLLKYLCKLMATPTGGEILDPFGGSMTTLVAAREFGRPAVAIEMVEDHCRIGVERLRQGMLFNDGITKTA